MNDETEALILTLETGQVVIEFLPNVAPNHVERIITLAEAGEYDNVAWHRVTDLDPGPDRILIAQTGDVEYGDFEDGYDPDRTGFGESDLPDLDSEFSNLPYERSAVGMARSASIDSGNSQFFVMVDRGDFLNGQYTLWGYVVDGMEFIDDLTVTGEGVVPDRIVKAEVGPLPEVEGATLDDVQDIALLYEAGLGRQAAYIGLNFWIDRFEDGQGKIRIAQAFLDSNEFAETVGDPDTLTDEEFIDALSINVIGRPLEGGRDFYLQRLEDGATRAQVLYAFATAEENAAQSPAIQTLQPIGDGDNPNLDPSDALRQDIPDEWDFVG